MNNYLIVYNRRTGELLRAEQARDATEALAGRFAEERTHRGDPDIEVVVLIASSWEQLHRTHGRYFTDLAGLAAELRDALKAS